MRIQATWNKEFFMKCIGNALLTLTWLVLTATPAFAIDLTVESLEGEWLYTHIVMEGGQEIPVNFTTIFKQDGSVIYLDATGAERGRGVFEIGEGMILYKDAKGPQEWEVISIEEDTLHVDHRGAGMFFERQ